MRNPFDLVESEALKLRAPDAATPIVSPNACGLCGIDKDPHARQWTQEAGSHAWTAPTQAQIKARMLARRKARLSAPPAKYHATTRWAPDHTGESPEPYCADCKTDGCRPWMRIQTRLDRQRWGLDRVARGASGGWGGDEPWPF